MDTENKNPRKQSWLRRNLWLVAVAIAIYIIHLIKSLSN